MHKALVENSAIVCLIIEVKNGYDLFVSGVSLTLSSLIEGKNFNQGGHKLGLGVDLEA